MPTLVAMVAGLSILWEVRMSKQIWLCPRCGKPMSWRYYPDGHDPSPECPVPTREAGYVGPHVVAGVCFAIATFCFVLLLLGGPDGAWK